MDTNDAQVRRSPQPGDTIDGRYLIGPHLGTGGMNEVYNASDLQAPKIRLILKVPRDDIDPGQSEIASLRLSTEFRTLQDLDGTVGIVHGVDYLDAAQGGPVLIEEFIAGSSLRDVLVPGVMQLGRDSATEVILQVLHALDALQKHGYAHGDIKPKNIMLRSWPKGIDVVLIDLGVAQRDPESDDTKFSHGQAHTPGYSSPERVMAGQPPSSADDVYACGVMFTEMLTGKLPTMAPGYPDSAVEDGESNGAQHVTEECVTESIDRLRTELDRVALRARSPLRDRYQTPAEMIEAVHAAFANAEPPSSPTPVQSTSGSQDMAQYDQIRGDESLSNSLVRNHENGSETSSGEPSEDAFGGIANDLKDFTHNGLAELHRVLKNLSKRKRQRQKEARQFTADQAVEVFNSSSVSQRTVKAESVVEEDAEQIIKDSAKYGSIVGFLIGAALTAVIWGPNIL